MRVNGQGTDLDPFRVYLAEADPSGPGHVIVVRDENGTLLQEYESMPPQNDAFNYSMHAFSAVQADSTSCTLWLTDVDNGGLVVQAAADGTILQHHTTPALFTSLVIDYSSDSSSPTLVLLSTTASDWQLWRFYFSNSNFSQLDTTQYTNSTTAVDVCDLFRAGESE